MKGLAVVAVAVLILLIVASVGVLVFVLFLPEESSDNTSKQIMACQAKVLEQLRAPATAQFSGEAVTRQSAGPYFEVNGLVDAQNESGAPIRQRYKCIVTAEGKALAATLTDQQ